MSTGKIIIELRRQKAWSKTELANQGEISRMMIGEHQRDEASPPIEAAKRIADALDVFPKALAGQGIGTQFDEHTLSRFQVVKDENKKNILLKFSDTYIRDYKTKQAYAS